MQLLFSVRVLGACARLGIVSTQKKEHERPIA